MTLLLFGGISLLIAVTGSYLFGDIGRAITSFFVGTFGFLVYPLLVLLIYTAVALTFGKNFVPRTWLVRFGFLTLAVFLIVHTATSARFDGSYGAYLSACYTAAGESVKNGTGGGVLFGLIVYPVRHLLSSAGAYILFSCLTALALYFVLLLTPLARFLKPGYRARKTAEEPKAVSFDDLPARAASEPPAPETAEPYEPSPSAPPAPEPYDPHKRSREILFGGNSAENYRNNLIYDEESQFNKMRRRRNAAAQEAASEHDRTGESADPYSPYPAPPSYTDLTPKPEPPKPAPSIPASYNERFSSQAEGERPAMPRRVTPVERIDREEDFNYPEPSYRAPSEPPAPTPAPAPRPPFEEKREEPRNPFADRTPFEEKREEPRNPFTERTPFEEKREEPRNPFADRTPLEEKREEPRNPFADRAPFEEKREEPRNPFADRTPFEEKREEPRNPFARGEEDRTEEDGEGRRVGREADEDDFSPFSDSRSRSRVPYEEDRDPFARTEGRRDGSEDVEAEEDVNDGTAETDESDFSPFSERRSRGGRASARSAADFLDDDAPLPMAVPEELTRGERGLRKTEKSAPEEPEEYVPAPYVRPGLDLFDVYNETPATTQDELIRNSRIIVDTLLEFRIDTEVTKTVVGASVTRYDLDISKGTSIKQVSAHVDEIAMHLHAGGEVNAYTNYEEGVVSLEVPNTVRSPVGMRSLLEAPEYVNAKPGTLMFVIGRTVDGKSVCGDVVDMTHLLIAGQSGSGKSVCLNTMLISLICRYSPEELRLILIDPKRVEFAVFDHLPHLMINEIIADTQRVIAALNWAIAEMERRYVLFEEKTRSGVNVHKLEEYNAALGESEKKLPKIVIVVDELADLMATAQKDIEARIQRLAAKARAAGIHLVLATQRPSVDVITGVIKNNLPTRIAFRVPSDADSRTILGVGDACRLLGNGDMLISTGRVKQLRVQGAYVSSVEVQNVVNFIKENNKAYFDKSVADYLDKGEKNAVSGDDDDDDGKVDAEYIRALDVVIQSNSASFSLIQRKCSVGYARAGKIIDWMERKGYISAFDGKAKPREVLITREEFEALYGDDFK